MDERPGRESDRTVDTSVAREGAPAGARDPGRKRIGPYDILSEIGRGGMGVVYRAFHGALKRTVALKVLIAGEDASEEAIVRFHREAESVAKLGHHPNIVPVYDIGVEGRLHYFAMNLVEGGSLEDAIYEKEIKPAQAALIAKKIAEALAHAHSHGVLHRDVKPANILLASPDIPDAASRQNDRPDGAPKARVNERVRPEKGKTGRGEKGNPSPASGAGCAAGNREGESVNRSVERSVHDPDGCAERSPSGHPGEPHSFGGVCGGNPPEDLKRGSGKEGDSGRSVSRGARLGTHAEQVARSGGSGNLVPLLTDFGLARDVRSDSRVTTTGVTLGTPSYMPPEQAGGRPGLVDARSDVYSLGATLYEMLALRPPFEGEGVVEVLQKVMVAEPRSPRKTNPAVDRDLETICLKCLDKDPGRRYQTAAGLADDLGRYLDGKPINARPASILGKLVKRAKRNRAATAAIAGIAILLAAGTAVALVASSEWSSERATQERRLDERKKEAETVRGDLDRLKARDEKRRAASRVMRLAKADLGPVMRKVKAGYYAKVDADALAANFEAAMRRIEEIGRSVGSDGASASVLLALRGWIECQGGRTAEGSASFAASREKDPDIALGWLLETAWLLAAYMQDRPKPLMMTGPDGITIPEPPVDGPREMERLRRIRDLVGAAGKAGVLGEVTEQDFESLVSGLLAVGRGDMAVAEEGLTRALAIEELWCVEEEIRIARAHVRLYSSRTEAGLEDAQQLVDWLPGAARFVSLLGLLKLDAAVARKSRGEPSLPEFDEAIALFGKALEIEPRLHAARLHVACALVNRADAEAESGVDPGQTLRDALSQARLAAEALPGSGTPRSLIACALMNLAEAAGDRGEDPTPLLEQARDEASAAFEANHADIAALTWAGRANMDLANWTMTGLSDRAALRSAAMEKFDAVLAADPGNLAGIINKSGLLIEMASDARADPALRARLFEEAARVALTADRDASGTAAAAPALVNAAVALGELSSDETSGADVRKAHLKRAREICERVLAARPDYAPAATNLGFSYIAESRIAAESGSDPVPLLRKAAETLEKAAQNPVTGVAARISLALAYYQAGEFEAGRNRTGREWYEKAVATLKDHKAGRTAQGLKQIGSALHGVALAEAALKRSPVKILEESVEAFDAAIRMNPFLGNAYNGRGIVLLMLARSGETGVKTAKEMLDTALSDFRKAIELGASRKTNLKNAAKTLSEIGLLVEGGGGDGSGRLKEAVATYTELLEESRGDPSLLTDRGSVLLALGLSMANAGDPGAQNAYEGAVRDMEAAAGALPERIDLRSNVGQAWQNLGDYYSKSGRDPAQCFDKAIAEYSKVLEKAPRVWQVHANIGILDMDLGRYAQASDRFRKAIELSGDRVPALRDLKAGAERLTTGPEWAREIERASKLIDRGKAAEALHVLEASLKAAGGDGNAKGEDKKTAQGAAWFQKARVHGLAAGGKAYPLGKASDVAPEAAAASRREAMRCLVEAVKAGFTDKARIAQEPALEPVRSEPGFADLVK